MSLENKRIVVTGGSRGLGLGLTEALVEQGAKVWVVARDARGLTAIRDRLGVETRVADITDAAAAQDILSDLRADAVILNAGATPPMRPIDQISWADFTTTWETDVKGGLVWLQAALNTPLAPGSRVLVGSSGAGQNGSPLSGGYAGAKRMLWWMAKYAQGVSLSKGLGIRFQAIVPMQIISGTGVGNAGAAAYAAAEGLEPEAFLARFGAPLAPRLFGDYVVRILTDPRYDAASVLGLKGDGGITTLDGATP